MALGIGSINSTSLFALSAIKKNESLLSVSLSQLSSGNRLVSAGIDPSGIAISASFRAQIGGSEQAIYNSQDAINLTRTADATLGGQQETLLRMRDLAVRAGNDATLTPQDQANLNAEFQSLNASLTQSGEASSFNTKQLTSATNPYGTQQVQSTPNNQPAGNQSVTINPSTAVTLGTSGQDLLNSTNAGNALTAVDTALANVSNQRANLGVTENSLNYTTNSLESSRINMMASNSSIADLNMAEGITNLTRLSMLAKFGLAALSSANAQAGGVLKLMGI